MAWVVDGNATGFVEQGAGILDRPSALASRRTLEMPFSVTAHSSTRDATLDLSGSTTATFTFGTSSCSTARPTLFDAIEFNDEIACIDVLPIWPFSHGSVATSAAAACQRGLERAYLAETRDFEGVRLLPLFLSCRSAVRSKTSATAASLQVTHSVKKN